MRKDGTTAKCSDHHASGKYRIKEKFTFGLAAAFDGGFLNERKFILETHLQ